MGLFGKKYDEMDFEIKSQNHKDTGTLYNSQGYDFKGFDKDGFDSKGWNKEGIHKDTGTRFFQGFDKDGFNEYGRNVAGWDKDGFGSHGNHINTGTKFNEDGFDKEGYNEDGWNKEGYNEDTRTKFNEDGWNKEGYNEDTRTKYAKDGWNKEGYNEDGFDSKGWSKEGIHKDTGTKYAKDGWNKEGYNEDGWNKEGIHKDTGTRFFQGFDQKRFNPEGWNGSGINKITATKYDEEGFAVNGWNDEGFYKSGLLAKFNTIEFNMIPFKGQEKFAKLRSGGTVDFYDSDSPAYILNVKLNDCSNEQKKILILKIRHSFKIKPSIFPTEKSVGAYWQTDLIDREIAKALLKRIITNFSNDTDSQDFEVLEYKKDEDDKLEKSKSGKFKEKFKNFKFRGHTKLKRGHDIRYDSNGKMIKTGKE